MIGVAVPLAAAAAEVVHPPGRVLLVDDSSAALDILRRLLDGQGLSLQTADDGEVALDLVRRAPADYDVVLMDLVMEHSDGVDVIRRMRPMLPAASRIIAMTASPSEHIAAECRAAGAEPDLLCKPFRGREVSERIRQSLQEARRGPGAVAAVAASAPAPAPLVPRRPAFDLEGTLERCKGDGAWLRALLEKFRDEGPQWLDAARDAWSRGSHELARRRLNRVRGEMLNLGMESLAARLAEAEEALRRAEPGTPLSCECQSGAGRHDPQAPECLNARVDGVRSELVGLLDEARLSPLLQGPHAATPDSLPDSAFGAFVQAVLVRDAEAFRMAMQRSRLLPERYAVAVEQSFRERFDSLEFGAAASLLEPADRMPTQHPEGRAGYRLLVAGDAPLTVRMLCKTLEGLGAVRFALSAPETLETVRVWSPHLVLADLNGGPVSGLELCRRIKRTPSLSATAVILVSADHDVAAEVAALTAGAADFIEKPLNPARIVGRVSAHLNQARRLMEAGVLVGGDVRNAPMGFLICTLDGLITEVNPSLSGWLGRGVDELAGLRLVDIVDLADIPSVRADLRAVADDGRLAPREVRMIGGDSAPVPVRMVGWTAPGPKGRIVWIAVEDLRDRMLEERRRADLQISQALTSLCGGIAHEFNNLLNVTIGHLDLAMDHEHREKQRAWLQQANDAALRAAEISRRLNATARRLHGGPSAAPLDALIDGIWPLLLGILPVNVSVRRETSPVALPVRLDVDGLRRSLSQLLRNACEAMPGGGRIVVRTAQGASAGRGVPGSSAVLEVVDEGCGMDEHTRRHAFDPFFTTHQSHQCGLGLSQVIGYVSEAGGAAELDSVPGQGTVVRLRFPLCASSRAAEAAY